MTNLRVNRSLKDESFRLIDHALGQPLDPMGETFRNYFCCSVGGKHVADFDSSPFWEKGHEDTKSVYFHVSDEGRKALSDHLKSIKSPHRAYRVLCAGWDQVLVSTSHAKACYSVFLDMSEGDDDLTFRKFLDLRPSVRLA